MTIEMKRLIVALLICLFFINTLTPLVISTSEAEACEKNVQIHPEDYNNLTLKHLSDLGATWVRMDYTTGTTESMINALHSNGYKVLAIIDTRTFQYNTPTVEEWNITLQNIAADPVSKLIDAWEIWNEPNALEEFNGAYVASQKYHVMLRCACAILKNSTKGLVISGGLAPHANFATYLNQTFGDSNINDCYDFFGLHLYNETLPANLAYVEEVKTVTGKDVWITELGRPSKTQGYTETNQASYLVDNIVGITSEVEKIFIYELYDDTSSNDSDDSKEQYFGLLNTNYEKKPAFSALKELRIVEENEEDEDKTVEPWYQNPIAIIVIVTFCALTALLIRQAYRWKTKSAHRGAL